MTLYPNHSFDRVFNNTVISPSDNLVLNHTLNDGY